MPIKKQLDPQDRAMLGGVSERAGAKAGGSNLSASVSNAILRVS
jgi:hypothetical protein